MATNTLHFLNKLFGERIFGLGMVIRPGTCGDIDGSENGRRAFTNAMYDLWQREIFEE